MSEEWVTAATKATAPHLTCDGCTARPFGYGYQWRELPNGFELRQVRLVDVTQFATDLDPALVYNFRSPEEFITRGVGLGILHHDTFVSGASSAAIGGRKVEIEIQTHPQFRRRGLARAVAAALILYCLEHGLEPCWDAANEPSASVARQLGFRSTGKYEAYRLIGDLMRATGE